MHTKFKVRIFGHFGTGTIYRPKNLQRHVTLANPLLPSFNILGLAAAKRRRLNYAPL